MCKNLFEQASNNYLLLLERIVLFLFSFRQYYLTISEKVALLLDVLRDIRRNIYTVTKATRQETLVINLGF